MERTSLPVYGEARDVELMPTTWTEEKGARSLPGIPPGRRHNRPLLRSPVVYPSGIPRCRHWQKLLLPDARTRRTRLAGCSFNCVLSLAEFRRRSGEISPIVFGGGVYVAKNSSQAVSVRVGRFCGQRVRATACIPLPEKGFALFRQLKQRTPRKARGPSFGRKERIYRSRKVAN